MDVYQSILGKMAQLRSRGLDDSHPEIIRLRIRLRDLLEEQKKIKKPKNPLLPKLIGHKTTITLDETRKSGKSKYAILGAAVGVAGVAYLLYKKRFS